jgi:hypothetical protein
MLAGLSTRCEMYWTYSHISAILRMELAFELVTFIRGHETHGLFRLFIFYVVSSTFYALFGLMANPADTCLEKVPQSWLFNCITVPVRSYAFSMYTSGSSSTLCDVACREIMRKLLRNSCGSQSLRQAALIDGSESSTRGSFRCIAGKCCLALRPVVFLYPTSY